MVLLLCGQFGTQERRPIQQARESPMGAVVLQEKDSCYSIGISIELIAWGCGFVGTYFAAGFQGGGEGAG